MYVAVTPAEHDGTCRRGQDPCDPHYGLDPERCERCRNLQARLDLSSELLRLRGLYGNDVSKVGAIDGTEDDYGDLLAEMSLLLGLPEDDGILSSRLLQQFGEFADGIIDNAEGRVTMRAFYEALAAQFGQAS